jgi:hypothetical protein
MASCENKYTTLLDLSRQAKVITGETACFDGKIEVGVPFSGYPTGVDTGTTVSLGVVSSETAVFSGNTGTTVFDVSNSSSPNYNAIFSGYSGTVWTNALFSGNTSGLTLPITTLSAETQIVGPVWTLTQTATTSNGEHIIGIQYTGYSITYSFSQIEQLSVTAYTAYSGFSSASQENFSAGTLDYKGPLDYLSTKEDATVDGRLTTNKLTVTDGASASTIGYVLTQLDETGKAVWAYNSSTASTNTFVTGGTLNSTHLDLTYNTGGSVPSIELSGLSTNFANTDLTFTGDRAHDTSGNTLEITNDAGGYTGSYIFLGSGIKGQPISWIGFGNQFIEFAETGSIIYYNNQNRLDITSGETVVNNVSGNFDFRVESTGSTHALFVQGSDGNVGVGTSTPTEKLDVLGNIKMVDGNESNGYVLTSDANGVGSWAASSGGITIDPYQDEGNVNSITWDVSGTSTNYEATLTGTTTLDLINVRNGDTGNIILTQDGTGSRTLSFGTVNGSGGTHRVVNGGGGVPTLTAMGGHTDILSFTYNGTAMYWTVGNDYD